MPRTKSRKNAERYWRRRTDELEQKWNEKSRQEIEKELAAYYRQSLEHIQKNVNDLYARFAKENGMDMVAAQRLLQGKEYRTWRMDMKEYMSQIEATGNPKLLRELNTLTMRSRISRLDKLYSETLVECAKLAEKTGRSMDRFLPTAYKDFYYRNLYGFAKQGELRGSVAKVDPQKMENMLRVPWSGKNYSQRIWKNNEELAKALQQVTVQAMHRGTSVQDLSRMVAQKMSVGYNDAERLVRTELNYVENQAALDSIKDAGFEYYQFSATLDNRTSIQCQQHDGLVFPVAEARPGDNMPPLHPRCRSTVIASFGEGERSKGKRIARDEEGRNIRVPADMKYEDWKSVYIDKTQTLEEWEASTKAATPQPGSAVAFAEAKVHDLEQTISNKQSEIDQLEDERNNITTVGEAKDISRKQNVIYDEIRDLKEALAEAKDNLAAQKNIEKYGDPFGFEKIKGKHSIKADLRAVNPNFTKGEEWQFNCQRCCAAYDARRKGYDVTALPNIGDNWTGTYKKPKIIRCQSFSGANCRHRIEDEMSKFGNGSRVIVHVKWRNGPESHVFIAERIRGKVYFIDPQSGAANVVHFFDIIDPSFCEICRVDNLEFSQKIREYCRVVKR